MTDPTGQATTSQQATQPTAPTPSTVTQPIARAPQPTKLTLPFLTASRLTSLGRADSDYHVQDVVMSIDGQDTLPTSVYLQLAQLVNVDLDITQENFIRMWKTIILKRSQDVYEKEKHTRPNHYVRLSPLLLVPAPLGDLLYSIGQYHNVNEGVVYDTSPLAQAAATENWWTVDAEILAQWIRTMSRMSKLYFLL